MTKQKTEKTELLHGTCYGEIEEFSTGYGLCAYCGDEGDFEISANIDGVTLVKFTNVTCNRRKTNEKDTSK